MKRPLFWVCAVLALLAILSLRWRDLEKGEDGQQTKTLEDPPWEGQRLSFSGRVEKRERQGDKEYFLLTDLSSFQDAAASRQVISVFKQMNVDGMQCFLAGDPGEAMPKIGSRVVVEGSFFLFREATNPGEFDFKNYYRGLGIGGRLTDVKILEEGAKYDHLRETLQNLRNHFAGRLDKIFPEREAGTMRTMLLGDDGGMDPELKKTYRQGGIIHVLTISGLHVTLLGMGLFHLLCRLGVGGGVAATTAGTVLMLYGMMTGMSVSACRAIGMFLLRMLARLAGRTYDLLTATAVMAFWLLCMAPTRGLQSGFWLSFGSVTGVGVILPILEGGRGEGGQKPVRGVKAGIAIFLATFPIHLLLFYETPTYATLLNLFVIPLMGPVLIFGFLAMAVPGLGILGTVDVVALRLFEKACILTSRLPFPTWNPGCPRAWQVVAYYGLLAAVLGFLWQSRKKKKRPAWILAALPILIFVIPTHRVTGITFLDVGQGDCICIREEGGGTWICDCGSSSRSKVGENVLLPYLKHEGIHRIDGIFLTHGDADHENGLIELCELAIQEGIDVDRLYLPDRGTREAEEKEFSDLLKATESIPGLETIRLRTGDVLKGENAAIRILNPGGDGTFLEGNEGSLCAYVVLGAGDGRVTALLCGDAEGAGEKRMLGELQKWNLRGVDVLKCAHHGSKNGTSDSFLAWIDAEKTVISCGKNNRYGHPHEETLLRLAGDGTQILRTDQEGAVFIQNKTK